MTELTEGVVLMFMKLAMMLLPIVIVSSLIRAIIFSPKAIGARGEWFVSRLLRKKLDPLHYKTFDDVYLPRPDGHGTTQIDHVLVSPFGVFVIETKNMKGWIFGSARSKQWTQTIYRKKIRFQNPLHQNSLHVNALADYLEIPKEKLKSIVFFVGDATLKTDLPSNVLTSGLVAYIGEFQTRSFDAAECEIIQLRLQEADPGKNRKKIERAHLQAIKKRKLAKAL